jgi:hypothetical protein
MFVVIWSRSGRGRAAGRCGSILVSMRDMKRRFLSGCGLILTFLFAGNAALAT